jgi:hypothetical protein
MHDYLPTNGDFFEKPATLLNHELRELNESGHPHTFFKQPEQR